MAQAQPAPAARVWTINRVLLVVGGICFFLAALAECGTALPDGTPAFAWFFGGCAAWILSGAIP